MSIQERLIQFLNFKDITPYRFCKDLGFSMGYLDKKGAIGTDKYLKIIEYYPEINPEWLLTGKGTMLKKDKDPAVAAPVNKGGVPLLPIDAFAGLGDTSVSGVDFETIEERYVIPLFDGLKIDFMIAVRGSSMYPKYSSGDVVACRLISELLFIQWNKVYVLDSKSQGVIMKRVKKSQNPDYILCKSDNKDYDDFEIPRSDIRNIALVVGVIRLE